MNRFLVLFTLVLWLAASVPAQLTRRERTGIEETLFLGDMTDADLGFDKKANPDPYRLNLTASALDDPLSGADELMALHEKANGTLADALAAGDRAVFRDPLPVTERPVEVRLPGDIPEALRSPLAHLIGCIVQADGHIRHALRRLTPAERRELIEGLPRWATGTSLVRFGFVRLPAPDPRRLLDLLRQIDLTEIRSAGLRLSRQIEGELPRWRSLSTTVRLAGTRRFRIGEVSVELSGQGDDDHSSVDSSLCIDLGGRNHYSGRYGAGVGYASVLIDCGQSTFDVPDLSVGAGLLGIGLAYELGGHADFHGRSLCFGSGVAGVGALFVDGSASRFQSVALSQGFGMFGCGLLLNTGGGDSFQTGVYGQGAARTQGLGWLISQQGDDVFRCGGLVPAASGHRSCGQGYASGFPVSFNDAGVMSGGCGLLTSLGGGNVYIGETSCQAAAELGGIASLYDAGGDGTRSAIEKSQGFADESSAAYLYDLGREDTFTCRNGACHGFANRLSVAFVLNRGDRSFWASQDGSPGSASAGGLGMFMNSGSDCSITGEPGQDMYIAGLHSVGLFCSLGQWNRLLSNVPFDTGVRDLGGIAYQQPTDVEEATADAPLPVTATQPTVSKVSVVTPSSDVFTVREYLVSLLRSPDPSAVGTAEGLLESKDLLVRLSAIDLVARFPSAALAKAEALIAKGDEGSQRTAVRLLGRIGTEDALKRVGKLLTSGDRGVQIECLEALNGRVPDSCLATVSALRNSPDSLIRSVARSVYVDR